MKKSRISIFILIFLLTSLSFFSMNMQLSAQVVGPNCPAPDFIPSSCRNDFRPDFNCINNKILNPKDTCCPNICNAVDGVALDPLFEINLFQTQIRLNLTDPDTIVTLINLVISTVLAIISLFALFKGIYLAAFKLTSTTDKDEMIRIRDNLVSLVKGFALAWGAILIIQLIATLFGLGSLNNITFSNNDETGVRLIILDVNKLNE